MVGQFRDSGYIKQCEDNETDVWQYVIINAHATVKSFVYLSTLIASAFTTRLLYDSSCKWRSECKDIYKGVTNEWDGKEDTLGKIVGDKFYRLHNNYLAVGKDTNIERAALKRWFLLSFLVYFTFVFIILIHIVRALSKGLHKDEFMNMIRAYLDTSIFATSFLVPYCTASWLNRCHQKYYEKMCKAYFEIKIALSCNVYLCNPGDLDDTKKQVQQDSDANDEDSTRLVLADTQPPEWVPVSEEEHRAVEMKYKEYYKEALRAPGSELRVKFLEFDFLPSFLIFSFPIHSTGYIHSHRATLPPIYRAQLCVTIYQTLGHKTLM